MRNYKDLQVWEKAHKLTLAVYKGMQDFPKEERFGLTSQIRRSSASIAANLAEGCGRRSDGENGAIHSDFNGFRRRTLISLIAREGPGFLKEYGIFQLELRLKRGDANAVLALSETEKCLGSIEASS